MYERFTERLDGVAREQMATEMEGHAEALRGFRAVDRAAFAAEVDRHLNRVAAILLDQAIRSRRTPAG